MPALLVSTDLLHLRPWTKDTKGLVCRRELNLVSLLQPSMKRWREEAAEPGDQEAGPSLSEPAPAAKPDAPGVKSGKRLCASNDEQQPSMPALDLTGQSSDSSADQLQRASPQESRSAPHHQSEQEQLQLVMELDSQNAPMKRRQLLQGYMPYPQHYQTWQEQQHNLAVCGIRLIGDAQQPDENVGVAVHTLVAHSSWAAARLRQTDMQTSGPETILPVCTPPSVVRKLVEALHSGFLELQEDVEQILVLANCMQVTTACHHMH